MAAVPIKIANAKIVGGGYTIDDATVEGDIALAGLSVGGGPIVPDPVVPPDPTEPPPDPSKPWEVKTMWTPEKGWVVVLVPGDDTLVPTPSKRK
jgi:hypothetical protein